MARKHVPPSRLKYEAAHPTVSFRLTKEEHAKLEAMRKRSGLSLAEMARRVLDIRKKELDEAYDRGFHAAYGRFDLPCKVCGKSMHFDLKLERDAEAAAAIRQTFSTWRHTNCAESSG